MATQFFSLRDQGFYDRFNNAGSGIMNAVGLYNMFKPGGTEDQRRQQMALNKGLGESEIAQRQANTSRMQTLTPFEQAQMQAQAENARQTAKTQEFERGVKQQELNAGSGILGVTPSSTGPRPEDGIQSFSGGIGFHASPQGFSAPSTPNSVPAPRPVTPVANAEYAPEAQALPAPSPLPAGNSQPPQAQTIMDYVAQTGRIPTVLPQQFIPPGVNPMLAQQAYAKNVLPQLSAMYPLAAPAGPEMIQMAAMRGVKLTPNANGTITQGDVNNAIAGQIQGMSGGIGSGVGGTTDQFGRPLGTYVMGPDGKFAWRETPSWAVRQLNGLPADINNRVVEDRDKFRGLDTYKNYQTATQSKVSFDDVYSRTQQKGYTPSVQDDVALLNAYTRLDNPGATVKEGTLELTTKPNGWSDALWKQYQGVAGGGVLTPETRAKLAGTAEEFYKGYQKVYDREKEKQIRSTMAATGLKGEDGRKLIEEIQFGGEDEMGRVTGNEDKRNDGRVVVNSEEELKKLAPGTKAVDSKGRPFTVPGTPQSTAQPSAPNPAPQIQQQAAQPVANSDIYQLLQQPEMYPMTKRALNAGFTNAAAFPIAVVETPISALGQAGKGLLNANDWAARNLVVPATNWLSSTPNKR